MDVQHAVAVIVRDHRIVVVPMVVIVMVVLVGVDDAVRVRVLVQVSVVERIVPAFGHAVIFGKPSAHSTFQRS
jgi:hypothetical protein